MRICLSRWCFTVFDGAVCPSKIPRSPIKILLKGRKYMGRPKELHPLGKYRLRAPKDAEKDKAYPVELEYTWKRQIIRKTIMSLSRLRAGTITAIRYVAKFVQVMAMKPNA